ncbi:MAG TPA: histidinol dehydrogenase, partial [Lachnospiraceae bacterium]|nr:histidinol dehydrogenase [Lachnospiraceae bacterium]
MKIVMLTNDAKNQLMNDLLKRTTDDYSEQETIVKEIISDIHDRRDEALFDYTRKFDKADLNADNVRVTPEEIEAAYDEVDEKLITVIRKAINNIKKFHEKQKKNSWITTEEDGTVLGQRIMPIESAGVYVPGGKAAYPSTVLMNVIPAKVAGVSRIVMTTPCNSEGKVYPTTLVAANEAGVTDIFKVGGAQAIAALAYGTESIPKVDKIVGPGN